MDKVRKAYNDYLDRCELQWWYCKFGGQFHPGGSNQKWDPNEIPTDEWCSDCPNSVSQTRLMCAANIDPNDKRNFPQIAGKCLKAYVKIIKKCPKLLW